MKLFQHTMIALTTATLIYGKVHRDMSDIFNRMSVIWSYDDAVALTIATLCLGFALLMAYQLASRTRLKLLAQTAFVFLISFLTVYLVAGFSVFLSSKSFFVLLALGAALLALPILALTRPALNIPYRLSRLVLMFSPIFLILTFQRFTTTRYDDPDAKFKTSFALRDSAHPVFIFIFDEWSPSQSKEDGRLKPFFENLEKFRSTAFTFHHAISPAGKTIESVPRFLFQKNYDFEFTDKGFLITNHGEPRLAKTEDNLFKLARAHEYNTALLGFYIHQRSLIGDAADSIETNSTRHDDGGVIKAIIALHSALIQKGVNVAARAYEAYQGPLPRYVYPKLEVWRYLSFGNPRTRPLSIEALFNEYAPKLGNNGFFFIHNSVPHAPFIFKKDGSERLPEQILDTDLLYDEEGYLGNLSYVDTLIGRHLETIDKLYGLDRSLVIITSDHGWRADPKMNEPGLDPEAIRHVPLFIRLPHQKEGVDIHDKIYLTNLRPVIEAVLSGQPERAEEELRKAAGQPEKK